MILNKIKFNFYIKFNLIFNISCYISYFIIILIKINNNLIINISQRFSSANFFNIAIIHNIYSHS